jgi:hypothetical protein
MRRLRWQSIFHSKRGVSECHITDIVPSIATLTHCVVWQRADTRLRGGEEVPALSAALAYDGENVFFERAIRSLMARSTDRDHSETSSRACRSVESIGHSTSLLATRSCWKTKPTRASPGSSPARCVRPVGTRCILPSQRRGCHRSSCTTTLVRTDRDGDLGRRRHRAGDLFGSVSPSPLNPDATFGGQRLTF